MKSKSPTLEKKLNFEDSMQSLEKIIEEMEEGNLPLENLLENYTQGVKLIEVCHEKISTAEQKIKDLSHSLKSESLSSPTPEEE